MKVSELLDDIFFRNGDARFLPLIKNFAGNDSAEIFGITNGYIKDGPYNQDHVRVLITMPDNDDNIKLKLFKLFIGNSTGEFERIPGLYFRDDILAIYSIIMADAQMKNMVSGQDLKMIAKNIREYIKQNEESKSK